jgi:hypothetical protein
MAVLAVVALGLMAYLPGRFSCGCWLRRASRRLTAASWRSF